jgi:hypothetical protein
VATKKDKNHQLILKGRTYHNPESGASFFQHNATKGVVEYQTTLFLLRREADKFNSQIAARVHIETPSIPLLGAPWPLA